MLSGEFKRPKPRVLFFSGGAVAEGYSITSPPSESSSTSGVGSLVFFGGPFCAVLGAGDAVPVVDFGTVFPPTLLGRLAGWDGVGRAVDGVDELGFGLVASARTNAMSNSLSRACKTKRWFGASKMRTYFDSTFLFLEDGLLP